MRFAGIDIGSRTISLVELDGKKNVLGFFLKDTGHNPLGRSLEMVELGDYDLLVATGYGRHLAKVNFADEIVTEIKAYALGTHFLFPSARTILDIGGQDTKVISINNEGKVLDFEMNDRCSAGTGRFLEVAASSLELSLEEMGKCAFYVDEAIPINSTCTVFAESEIVSLVSQGKDRFKVALGLHQALVTKSLSLLNKVGVVDDVVFAGGVAKNPSMVKLFEKKLGKKVYVPDEPQMVGALGAALYGLKLYEEDKLS